MKALVRPFLASLLCAGLLSACGGGVSVGFVDDDDDFFIDDRPFRSGRAGSVTVNAATDPRVVGTYASDDVRLTHVFRFSARGSTPETCRFQFEDLADANSRIFMSGEIQYLPGTDTVHASFIVVDNREYLVGTSNLVRLDRASNAIVFHEAVLNSTFGNAQAITISGTVPMRNERTPAGC